MIKTEKQTKREIKYLKNNKIRSFYADRLMPDWINKILLLFFLRSRHEKDVFSRRMGQTVAPSGAVELLHGCWSWSPHPLPLDEVEPLPLLSSTTTTRWRRDSPVISRRLRKPETENEKRTFFIREKYRQWWFLQTVYLFSF
jgi:hypothetical protein